LHRYTQGSVSLLLMAGVHGDEAEGVALLDSFLAAAEWQELDKKACLWVIPQVNPDGLFYHQRGNARGVDLNRNMPTQDWIPSAASSRYYSGSAPQSEPETKAVIEAIESVSPRAIFSLHSQTEVCVNYNGPARTLAEVMAACNGYPVTDDIGYPTPGSLGTWAGVERRIPTITLELPRGASPEEIWIQQKVALGSGLRFAAEHEHLS
jgi:protein MpaA